MSRSSSADASPEMRLILAASRQALGVAQGGSEVPWREVDPESVGKLSLRHRLEGLVHHGPEGMVASGLSQAEPSLEVVREAARGTLAANLRRIAETQNVVEVLTEAGIAVIPFKGPTLAVQAYGDVARRAYGDVDVLVRLEDARDAIQTLLGADYVDRWVAGGRAPSPKAWHEWGFTAPDGETLVELHWSLVRPDLFPGVDSGEAWSATESVEVLDATFSALRTEVLIPFLCIHSTRHAWGWLEYPASIAGLVLHKPDLDWDELLARVKRWRVRRIVAVGVSLAAELFGVTLPARAAATLLPDARARRAAEIFSQRLTSDAGEPPRSGSPSTWWLQMQLRDSLMDGWSTGWRLLLAPTPTDWFDHPGEGVGGVVRSFERAKRLVRSYAGRSR